MSRERGGRRAEKGELLAGNIDAYLLWNLTGGPNGGKHLTDVTNASRTTQLMNLDTLAWDEELLKIFDIPPRNASGDSLQQRAL